MAGQSQDLQVPERGYWRAPDGERPRSRPDSDRDPPQDHEAGWWRGLRRVL